MKKLATIFAITVFTFLSSCSVNESTPGPAGQNGFSAESLVFEISNTNFQSSNSFSRLFVFPRAILASDHVLVYRLSGLTSQNQDIWTILPKQYFLTNGTFDFSYNFDFTKFDVSVFMEGNNLSTVNSNFRVNQIFRIVVIPGQFGNKISNNNIKDVMNTINVSEKDVVKL